MGSNQTTDSQILDSARAWLNYAESEIAKGQPCKGLAAEMRETIAKLDNSVIICPACYELTPKDQESDVQQCQKCRKFF